MPHQIAEPLLAAFDEVVTSWPEVHGKGVFGHRGYVRGGKMFAFLADGGVSVKTPGEADQEVLYARATVHPFAHSGMPMRVWPVLPVRTQAELDEVLDLARRRYEAAE
jgi:hypothetical protein